MRIVVAEDDPVTQRSLDFLLTKGGHEVLIAPDGITAYKTLLEQWGPVLAILDVMLPGLDGVEICRRVRSATFTTPPYLIILTVRGGKDNIVRGFEAGADDYITKPFDREELMARIKVGLRILELQQKLAERVRSLEEALSRAQKLQGLLRADRHTYEFGGFKLEAAERRLLRDGDSVPLTAKMFDLLLLLVQNVGHLIEKEEIMREIWPGSFVEDNNLTVTMSALRKVLGELPGGGSYIETIPKRGYRFTADVRGFPQGETKPSGLA